MRLIMTILIILLSASIFLVGADCATPSPTEARKTINDEISLLSMELRASDPKTRLAVVSRLATTRNPRAIDPLLKAFKDHADDFQLRQAVITALGDIQDNRAVDTAIEALRDYVFHVRKAAAEALGKLGDKKAIVPLLMTFDDKEETVREAAVDSLAKLGEPGARIFYENMYKGIDASERLPVEGNERLYNYIFEAFPHWDLGAREGAIWVLGRIKHEKIMNFLIQNLGDKNSYVRAAAAWSLKEKLNARATAELISVLKDPSPIVREAAAYNLGNARSPDPVPSLIEALKDGKPNVREAAAWSLYKIKDQRATEALCSAVADPDHRVRRAAAWGLGELEISTISFDVLVGALHDENEEVREAAVWSLAKPNERRASSAILKVLEDPSEKVRTAAAYALGKIGDHTVADQLLRYMNDESPAARDAVAEALDKLDPPLGQLINKSLKGDREAGALLAARRDPRVAQLFLDELEIPTSVLRQSAIWYLTEVGEPRAPDQFVRMARGWNIRERFAGGKALSKLELRPIYKNFIISLDVFTSPASITYFFVTVFLAGIIFYAACPYSLIRRLLHGITRGSMIAGVIFYLPVFSFSWMFFAFLTVSIFPFIVLGSLSALLSLHPVFRFLLGSEVDSGKVPVQYFGEAGRPNSNYTLGQPLPPKSGFLSLTQARTHKRTLVAVWTSKLFGTGWFPILAFAALLAREYLRICETLPVMPWMEGDSNSYILFSEIRPHGYSIFLAGYRTIIGDFSHLPATQAALYVIAVGMLGMAISRHVGTILAGVSVLYIAINAPFLDFGGIMSDTVYASLLALGAASYLFHGRSEQLLPLIFASSFLGMAAATRTIGYIGIFSFLVCVMIHARSLRWPVQVRRLTTSVLPAAAILCIAAASNYAYNGQFRIGSWGGVSLLGKGLLLAAPLPEDNSLSKFNWIPAKTRPARQSLDNTSDLALKMLMTRQYYEYLRWFLIWKELDNRSAEWQSGSGPERERLARHLAISYIMQDLTGYAALAAVDYASLWSIPRILTASEASSLSQEYATMKNVAFLKEFSQTDEGKNEYFAVVPSSRPALLVYFTRITSAMFLIASLWLMLSFLQRGSIEALGRDPGVTFLFMMVHLSYICTALTEAGLERYVSATWALVATALSAVAFTPLGNHFQRHARPNRTRMLKA